MRVLTDPQLLKPSSDTSSSNVLSDIAGLRGIDMTACPEICLTSLSCRTQPLQAYLFVQHNLAVNDIYAFCCLNACTTHFVFSKCRPQSTRKAGWFLSRTHTYECSGVFPSERLTI